jgi:hypothetical protein
MESAWGGLSGQGAGRLMFYGRSEVAVFLQHGFDEWVSIEDNYIAYYSEGRDRDLRSNYHHFLARKGYKPGKRGTFGRSFAASLPIEECKPKFLETKACDLLRGNRGNPFVLYINFLEPHMPFHHIVQMRTVWL